jgi:hypothetical protein
MMKTHRGMWLVIMLLAGMALAGLGVLLNHVAAEHHARLTLLPVPIIEWRIGREKVWLCGFAAQAGMAPDFECVQVGPLVLSVPSR